MATVNASILAALDAAIGALAAARDKARRDVEASEPGFWTQAGDWDALARYTARFAAWEEADRYAAAFMEDALRPLRVGLESPDYLRTRNPAALAPDHLRRIYLEPAAALVARLDAVSAAARADTATFTAFLRQAIDALIFAAGKLGEVIGAAAGGVSKGVLDQVGPWLVLLLLIVQPKVNVGGAK